MFQVQARRCRSCIYRPGSAPDLAQLEAEIADPRMAGHFTAFRECHEAPQGSGICCAGFFAKHRDHCDAGQVAQRLGWVEYVAVDIVPRRNVSS